MTSTVSVSRHGDVAVIMLDNPPVNALSHHLREPLDAALKAERDDSSVKAIVLACAGRTFVAGADITEFGKPQKAPSLRDLIDTLESITTKPTVAAIHGTALGGGLELALGCHFRVADKGARLGLPEVKLGILPGAGGTVRLPRIVGPEKAVAMIVSGTPIGALEAEEAGLVDALVDNLVADAVAFAREAAETNRPLVAVRDRTARIEAAQTDMSGFEKAAAEATKKTRGLEAPLACAEAVRNAITMKFDDALDAERRTFERLVAGDQSKAQRHLFFAEREAARVEGVGKEVRPREIRKAAVIGAGTMGGGIAMSFVNGGIPVTILEMSKEALDRGLGVIDRNYGISVSRGSLSPEAHKKRMAMFTPTTSYDDLADADIIIEAVFEEMAVKKEVFSRLDAIAKPGAILASNTSYLDVNEIAAMTKRPADVLGMHFFSPANVMKLLEIVRGKETAPDVIATALATAKRIGKVPVVVGVCHGFVGNRMLSARSADLESLLLEGATPQQVDKVFTDFGWPMGPFAMGDLAGLDIGWRNRKSLGRKAAIADAICEMGRYGQKTGRGYYVYEKGSRTPTPDPEIEKLIEDKARELGVNRRTISSDEIAERTMYPMVNEGARILEEKIAARPSDIDIVWINGYGFPVGRGGPMFWADLTGLKKIAERLEYWHGKTGKDVFAPSLLLKKLAAEGKGFSSLQASKA
ncbi:3-hydroxyacyl-CoA dehydrogenase NAD-binding domain-containing protein [Mesorhizobium koreense]|uniref:3-hydroxyacyl-CoA dehydrogenase NAD-binding domain-containing protein n=1 Tax=Mesorhizobium koreense TaxID=3074855 RepID=UPI00287BA287|nr:3-hydroxyacyl-CoA dehydrogenase NAD-binding domain-containing protein [Mesorhizobium sp. WR6]